MGTISDDKTLAGTEIYQSDSGQPQSDDEAAVIDVPVSEQKICACNGDLHLKNDADLTSNTNAEYVVVDYSEVPGSSQVSAELDSIERTFTNDDTSKIGTTKEGHAGNHSENFTNDTYSDRNHLAVDQRTHSAIPAIMPDDLDLESNGAVGSHNTQAGTLVRTRSNKKLTYNDENVVCAIQSKRPSAIVRERSYSFRRSRNASVKLTKEQKINLFCVCMVSFASSISMSIIAPFFPKEASLKGMREAVAGFVFSIYALVMMIFSPIFGKLVPHAGAKFIFLSGILFTGVSNILFGFLDHINDTMVFTVMCFIVRSFEALGASAFTTSAYTYLIHLFPNNVGTAFGITETFVGLGMSIGPAVGGMLYSVGGYGLPFYTLGVFVLINIPISWLFLKPIESVSPIVNTASKSYKDLLVIPEILVVSIVLIVASQGAAFLDPTLEPYFRTQYDLDSQIVGALFLVFSVSYSIFSIATGRISGMMKNKYPIMIVGLLLMAVALVMIGPPSVIPVDESLWLSISGIVLMGAAFALAYIPTFESIFIIALNHGLKEDIGMYALVSGLWSSMFSLGEVTGPSLGGVLSDVLSFPVATFVMAGFAVVAAIILLSAACCCAMTPPKQSHKDIVPAASGGKRAQKSASLEEKMALLHDSSHKMYGSNDPSREV